MGGLFNAKRVVEEGLSKPLDVSYNRFYKQMRQLRTLIEKNNSMMRYVSIVGTVISGTGRDTRLFYPTANIQINVDNNDGNSIAVKNGSYISNLVINKVNYDAVAFVNKSLVKTHIIDFNENIFGKRITVRLIQFLRSVEAFETDQDLINAIASDIFIAKDYFLHQRLEKLKL